MRVNKALRTLISGRAGNNRGTRASVLSTQVFGIGGVKRSTEQGLSTSPSARPVNSQVLPFADRIDFLFEPQIAITVAF